MKEQSDYNTKTKPVSEEDSLRVSRLREEIIARVTEVSLIMARTLEKKPPSPIREFILTDGPRGEPLGMSVLKTDSSTAASPTATIVTWGCHCEGQKICCDDPLCPPCH